MILFGSLIRLSVQVLALGMFALFCPGYRSFVSLDNLSSVCTTFSGASFVSGIALTAASMPGVGILVGLGLMVGHGVYNDVSNIIEYKKSTIQLGSVK
ncbi:hypothetical protein NPIL_696941 [Nephila pilipes]|uniref:Uncharacterized protein n=1 Tax=Nephila pilipes TaxID=299642 RepID=A0A8X6MRM3_NEPPI|nr:hypothetical protein NPIL_696941 [Nephila pilipes]